MNTIRARRGHPGRELVVSLLLRNAVEVGHLLEHAVQVLAGVDLGLRLVQGLHHRLLAEAVPRGVFLIMCAQIPIRYSMCLRK